jgi:hypothetical protein
MINLLGIKRYEANKYTFTIPAFSINSMRTIKRNRKKPQAMGKLPYTWEALKNMPVPTWFEDAKFGIFIHWGP